MTNYNINILKQNILKLMNEKGITQSALAKGIGMQQSRISKILNPDNSDCFTVQQLADIARFLHVSTDTLLGLEIAEGKKDLTLYDIYSKLFDLSYIIPLHIGVCAISDTEQNDTAPFDCTPDSKIPCIYFDNEQINDFLSEWDNVRNITVEDQKTKYKLINMWKDDTLNKSQQCFKKWDFLSKREYQKKIMSDALSCMCKLDTEFPPTVTKEEMDFLEEYLRSGCWHFDGFSVFDEKQISAALRNAGYTLNGYTPFGSVTNYMESLEE